MDTPHISSRHLQHAGVALLAAFAFNSAMPSIASTILSLPDSDYLVITGFTLLWFLMGAGTLTSFAYSAWCVLRASAAPVSFRPKPVMRLLVVLGVTLALAGCAQSSEPVAPVPVASETAAAPVVFDVSASNGDNFTVFNTIAGESVEAKKVSAQNFGAALIAAGFPERDIQVSQDTTSAGLDVISVSFAVKVGDECFIGQYGPSAAGLQSERAQPTQTGACLIGLTQPLK